MYAKLISRPCFIINITVLFEIFDCNFSTKEFEPTDAIECLSAEHLSLFVLVIPLILLYVSFCIRFIFVGSDLSYLEVASYPSLPVQYIYISSPGNTGKWLGQDGYGLVTRWSGCQETAPSLIL